MVKTQPWMTWSFWPSGCAYELVCCRSQGQNRDSSCRKASMAHQKKDLVIGAAVGVVLVVASEVVRQSETERPHA